MAAEAAGEIAPAIDGIIGDPRLEPQRLVPVDIAPTPGRPVRVRAASLTLEPGASYLAPSGPCQDVLLYVRSGELLAAGTGISSPSAPATLYPGDAIRFGPEGDGLVRNVGTERAHTIVAAVRDESAGEPELHDVGPDTCPARSSGDAIVGTIVETIRSASSQTTTPLSVLGGQLSVRILLDTDGQAARYGGLSVLEGPPDLLIPEHRHNASAELLFIEDGSGVMQVGEQRLRVRPGAALYMPEGVLHHFEGDGSRPFRAIQVYSPSGPEQRYR